MESREDLMYRDEQMAPLDAAEIVPDTPIEQILKDTFGFDSFRDGQRDVVEHLLAGRSALAVFPTGGGKSLCYQLPALKFEGLTLVVSPLIALMKDQIDFLVRKGVRAARLDSSLSAEETRGVWDDLWNQRLKLLYVAPERFASERFLQRLRRSAISLMVVDEAHCISEWGHNFRPDYLKLAELSRELHAKRVLTLTATATASVAEDICRNFSIAPEAYINTGFHRPNLVMRAIPCSSRERDALLLSRLRERPRGATIVYVTLQKTAEQVARALADRGISARAYHAGMDGELRHEVQDWFMASPDAVVVATIAFGMGIDKSDIRYVYHYNMPKSLENYMQETGRAGRDGMESGCDLLVCPDDIATLENFTYGDTPTLQAVQGLVAHLLEQPDIFDLSIYDLAHEYDIRNLVISTLLTYLELRGIIASTGPLYNEYKFQPNTGSAEMLQGFDEARTRFLRAMFSKAEKGRTWFSIDIAATASELGEKRERLVAALNYFEEKGDLTLKVAGLRHGYRFVKRPDSTEDLAQAIFARFQESETRDIARLGQVVELASMQTCTVRSVLNYFGESLESDCGHCDRCLGEPVLPMPRLHEAEITEEQGRAVAALVGEQHAPLATPRQLARFLCGLPSPAASRARLTKDNRFGLLSRHRFATVLDLSS
ncbi:MAG: RecQ family ATP-dependent DNA helicase [Verrucomicrobia bacterium]|nr:RecQ family ATP-dependent DNA helicase [Verrucomicrobiota bacterium]MDA1086682.1 RecQ family ATP-dependent DNA helicase [Verrucomicrobiota bacterium]